MLTHSSEQDRPLSLSLDLFCSFNVSDLDRLSVLRYTFVLAGQLLSKKQIDVY